MSEDWKEQLRRNQMECLAMECASAERAAREREKIDLVIELRRLSPDEMTNETRKEMARAAHQFLTMNRRVTARAWI